MELPSRLYFVPYRFMPVSRSVNSEVQARQRKFTNLIIGFKYVGLSAILQCYFMIRIVCNKFVGAANGEDKFRSLYGPSLQITRK
jgi:hypothetical protein